MPITAIIPQLRTTELAESIRFYTTRLGFTLEFDHGGHFHLYLQTGDVDATAERLQRAGASLERDVHETSWRTRELVVKDDQGHTLYFGQPAPIPGS